MTLSFHKVTFTADEVLDMIAEIPDHYDTGGALAEFREIFTEEAEKRSRQ